MARWKILVSAPYFVPVLEEYRPLLEAEGCADLPTHPPAVFDLLAAENARFAGLTWAELGERGALLPLDVPETEEDSAEQGSEEQGSEAGGES